MAKQPEQFNPHPTDGIRKELDSKIDKKVSNHVFYAACTLFVAALAGFITYVITESNKQSDKQGSIAERLVRIETRMESIKSK